MAHIHRRRQMTTLYKPVLIESAEQAEALPEGTIATDGKRAAVQQRHTSHGGTPRVSWWITDDQWDPYFISEKVVCWTALVPIEAEEETSVVVSASGFRDIATHPYSEASMDSDGNVWFGEGLSRVDVTDQRSEERRVGKECRYVWGWLSGIQTAKSEQ